MLSLVLQELSQCQEARLNPQLDIGEGLHLGQEREQGLEQEQEVEKKLHDCTLTNSPTTPVRLEKGAKKTVSLGATLVWAGHCLTTWSRL